MKNKKQNEKIDWGMIYVCTLFFLLGYVIMFGVAGKYGGKWFDERDNPCNPCGREIKDFQMGAHPVYGFPRDKYIEIEKFYIDCTDLDKMPISILYENYSIELNGNELCYRLK